MAKLTKEQRDKLPDRLYGLPSKRMFPMPDEHHVRLAWDMVDRAKGLTEEEREEARRRILRRAKELGIDTSNWNKKKLKAEEDDEILALQAAGSNIFVQDLEHPNKMPFKGILTYFDVPSDRAPGGASGMRVLIPSEVGIPALASLKGMAVNFADGWDGHDPHQKIGVITDAYTGDPLPNGAVPVYVEGYIFAHDFEDVAFEIKANQSQLGFSYETAMTRLEPGEYNGEPVLIVRELGYFTGASILLKAHAAYQQTSIAANAAEGGFNLEELKELLASAIEDLKKYVDEKLGEIEAKAAKNAKKDEETEEKTEKIKVKPEKMAGKDEGGEIEAEDMEDEEEENEEDAENKGKAKGRGKPKGGLKASVEESVDLLEELKALRQEIAELKASKAEAEGDVPPERKSVAFPRTLMAKYAMDEEDDFEKAMKAISERKDLDVEQRLALKLELMDKQRRQQQ